MSFKLRKIIITATLLLCFLNAGMGLCFGSAGLLGDCADCHTMHNSEQGNSVAVKGLNDTSTVTPIENLLRMDCIACHVVDPSGSAKIAEMGNGSMIPQVMHADNGDLAGGNFRYISESGNRKGHNVIDVVSAETDLTYPPGYRHADGAHFEFDVTKFTCAGQMGCHGFRGQVLIPEVDADPVADPPIPYSPPVYRTGLNALSGIEGNLTNMVRGAHHNSYDGVKLGPGDPDYLSGPLVHSYRFIRGLRGYGNEVDRWQNIDAVSHNEYIGFSDQSGVTFFGAGNTECGYCHKNGQNDVDSAINTPNQSITGFCVSCHTTFHSSGTQNGVGGAFLRHPSDWIIPDRGEYSAYQTYNISAPVARPYAFLAAGQGNVAPSSDVTAGVDLVMCLSCHVAHASPYDGMLRFDYATVTSQMQAGAFADVPTAEAKGGCLACHTTKGVLPQNRPSP